MILPTDIPTRAEIDRLLEYRAPSSVSIYLPTDPASNGDAERIEFKTLAAQASTQLGNTGVGVRVVRQFEEQIDDLHEDGEFWRYQARSLAAFAAPESLITFRLPNRLVSQVEVSDRFHLRPLLRTLTFPHVAFVLALAQGSVRIVEVSPDLDPVQISVDDLPSNVAGAAGKSSISDRAPIRRIQGAEGQKVRMRQYARQVDRALRPFLNGLEVPLILAATEPIDSIYRSVNTYPHLLEQGISGNPETASDAELAASSRKILDDLYAAQLREVQERYEQRTADRRALSDVAEVGRAATFGAVETLLVDIDAAVPGTLDDQTGAVSFADSATGDVHDVTDEIARRAWLSGARVLAVRDSDIPGRGAVAAILRYPL
ncbi:MAG: baeRF11 domain-containing protein [Solirubrobacteraceae bacterium]